LIFTYRRFSDSDEPLYNLYTDSPIYAPVAIFISLDFVV
jgi:hypothetical protein